MISLHKYFDGIIQETQTEINYNKIKALKNILMEFI